MNTIASGIQIGDNTQVQDQSILLVSFSTTNINNNGVAMLTDVDDFDMLFGLDCF